jgi:hypothetical protein
MSSLRRYMNVNAPSDVALEAATSPDMALDIESFSALGSIVLRE